MRISDWSSDVCSSDLKLAFVPWAEAVRISAMHGSGLRELFRAIHRAHDSATRTFSPAEVTRALEIAYQTNPPPLVRGHVAKLRFPHPGAAHPQTFIVHGPRLTNPSATYHSLHQTFFHNRFKQIRHP